MKSKIINCINCERYVKSRGYCDKCYPLILKIEKLKNGEFPKNLEIFKRSFTCYEEDKREKCFKAMMSEMIKQLEWRLSIIKDSEVFQKIGEHDLEYRINGTLRILDHKTLGKMNDELKFYLGEKERAYIYRMFSRIQLLKPFRYNYSRILEAGYKES